MSFWFGNRSAAAECTNSRCGPLFPCVRRLAGIAQTIQEDFMSQVKGSGKTEQDAVNDALIKAKAYCKSRGKTSGITEEDRSVHQVSNNPEPHYECDLWFTCD